MPKLVIDNQSIEMPRGTKVIQAAERLGIYIPRLCYHEALGAVGACRLCAVMFLEGPVKGLQMSCMTEVADGMVVSTDHPEALRFRRQVIEWLMLNHPHDCPVCDEGGQCVLQDMTVSGGHGIRRYDGPKRTFKDQDLGPFVAHEMNRCIHCWRCRRFYQEYAGYRDLGAMQIGHRTYFGRQKSGRLESPFAGNLVDICPTGVFTDKPSRYQGRYWDFSRAASVCPHCSLGCAVTLNSRYRKLVRLEARAEPEVNGHFICDRGRYGYGFSNHPARPRRALIDGREADYPQAVGEAAKRLRDIAAEYGPSAVAALGSCRMGLEAQVALQRLCQGQGWSGARFFLEPDMAMRVGAAARGLTTELAVSQAELAGSDFILSVGVEPLGEAPMLAMAMRQAWRAGALIASLDPRPAALPLPLEHLPLACELQDAGLAWLVNQSYMATKRKKLQELHPHLMGRDDGAGLSKKEFRGLKKLSRALAKSQRPVLVCGVELAPQGLPARCAGLTGLLCEQGKQAGLFYVMPGANALGAALVAPREAQEGNLLEAMEAGEVRALLLTESDPLFNHPDRERMTRALKKLRLLVVLDHLPSPVKDMADIFIPVSNLFEDPGASLVNQESRLQMARPVAMAGTPLEQINHGGHPPREYSLDAPGGGLRPSGQILYELGQELSSDDHGTSGQGWWEWLAGRQPALDAAEPSYGHRLLPISTASGEAVEDPILAVPGDDMLEIMVSPANLPGDELAAYSPALAQEDGQGALWLHPQTADELGLTPGGAVRISLEGGDLALPLRTAADMHPRTAVLAPGRDPAWQMLRGRRQVLPAASFKPGDES